MEIKRAIPFDINISASANNGFIIKVGCGQFVADSKSSLLRQMDEFLSNPDKYVEIYNKDVAQEVTDEDSDAGEHVPRRGQAVVGRLSTREHRR